MSGELQINIAEIGKAYGLIKKGMGSSYLLGFRTLFAGPLQFEGGSLEGGSLEGGSLVGGSLEGGSFEQGSLEGGGFPRGTESNCGTLIPK